MNTENLNESYWTRRYEEGTMGWDLGYASPPLVAYFDQLVNKDLAILIPGAGNAYEADYLFKAGFTNITICDLSAHPLRKYEGHPVIKTIHGDFFELRPYFDLIIEQTFFCALDPTLRTNYRDQCFDLLKPGGKLAGLLFKTHFEKPGPPFGGHQDEYQILFGSKFHIKELSDAYNSITPRFGNELFVIMEKRV
ncbi:MAG: methyltransferase domain-containing protein [Saprospiraceae bacterium]|jgi:SAM-dependent methyltransferase|nr:methyltransferase domain-containing protein [Saprospiraceae bacterium]MBP9193155.1 methyltransferase domain-containing protein [Saprospiraceae bacterium]